MAAPTNTLTTVGPGAGNIGAREDLEDILYRVAAEETPFISTIGRAKAKAVKHDWQIETLAAPSATNASVEGNDVGSHAAPNVPTRVGNICQILTKDGSVSRTQQVVDLAGRSDEFDRQKVIKGIEIKRDLEARAIGNFASNVESGSTPRRLGGALAWITTSTSRGGTGANGGWNATTSVVDAATNASSTRTFTESLVKAARATAFANGGKASIAYMGPTHKQQFSAFTGIASIRKEVKGNTQATIIGAADCYVDDFGELMLVPHPYGLTRDCLLADPKMFAIATLDGIKTEALAKTGDADRFLMTWECTLVCKNEKAHAVVADLS